MNLSEYICCVLNHLEEATSLNHKIRLIPNKSPDLNICLLDPVTWWPLFIHFICFPMLQIGELAGIAVGATVLLNVMFAGYYCISYPKLIEYYYAHTLKKMLYVIPFGSKVKVKV